MPKKTREMPTPDPPERPRGRGGLVFLGLALAAIAAGAAWWWLRTPAFTLATNPNRNVLLVTIDTLRADALGSYGGRATTPNLDRLASHGARFSFAHSHAVVTLVSHASILSGRYPYEHGVRDNTGYRFPPDEPTAATLLKAQGFSTAAFIGGFPLDHRFGLDVGFDVYDDHLNQASAGGSDRERRADAVVASALDWMGKQPGKWFAFVHVYDPHEPYEPPGEWASKFPSDPYLGEVSWTDSALGALFARLGTQPRPTLVVVTGDHGESLGEHGERTHSLFGYEATLHVPLIVSEVAGMNTAAPAAAPEPRGVVVDTPVRHIDILPTLLDAIGAPVSAAKGTDGRALSGTSLKALIASGSGADRPSYFEAMTANVTRGWAPLRGVLVGREKYIDLPITELYDLAKDPDETSNVAPVRTERTQVLMNVLKGFDVSPPGRPRAETPETLERLRSLGYIGGAVAAVREKYTDDDDPKRLVELEQTMHKAKEVYASGHADDAIALYQSVIARRADTEDAYRQLALVYWNQGRQADAIATLETALKNGVTQSEVRIKLGQYLAEAGQADKAIQLLESSAGDDPDALIVLGNAYQLAGRAPDAMRTLKHAIDVDPKNGLAYQNLGVEQLRAKDYAGAEASLRKAIDVDPAITGAYTALGVVLADTGRKADAIDVWKRAVDLDPSEFDALFNLTRTLFDLGRLDEARAYGERYIATAPPALQADVEAIRKLLGKAAPNRV